MKGSSKLDVQNSVKMSVMFANKSQMNNGKFKAHNLSVMNMKRKLQGLLHYEGEHNREIKKEVPSGKRQRVCKYGKEFYYGEFEMEENSDKEDSEVEDTEEDEDYEVNMNKRAVRSKSKNNRSSVHLYRNTKAVKELYPVNHVIEKASMKQNALKPMISKVRTKGRTARCRYNDLEKEAISKSSCTGSSDSYYSSSSLTTGSPTSVNSTGNSDGDSIARSRRKTSCSDNGTQNKAQQRAKLCHQCRKNDSRYAVPCKMCKEMLYCVRCIRHWYPQISEEEIAESCPFCRRICNCNECLRTSGRIKTSKQEISSQERTQHLRYLVRLLHPFVKQIQQQQSQEIQLEADIQGLPLSEDDIPESSCFEDERIYCNQCATSIFDLHRSCPNCCYELCLGCCQEIRQGKLLGGPPGVPYKYTDKGYDYIHGGDPLPSDPEDKSSDTIDSLSEWKAYSNGRVPCPSTDRGGCGNGNLELRRILPKGWIRTLEMKAALVSVKSNDMEQTSLKSPLDKVETVCQAGPREKANDDHLYCPTSSDALREGAMTKFREHWVKGEPVIVRDALQQAAGLSWEPMVMWRALCENVDSNIKAIDCLANCEEFQVEFEWRWSQL